jgi:hypothetical protein
MADVTNINKLIESLIRIEKAEREEYQHLEKLKQKKAADILEKLGEPKKP